MNLVGKEKTSKIQKKLLEDTPTILKKYQEMEEEIV